MRIETLGDGEPEIAVIGGIHGDEPSGQRAVEGLMEDPPDVERPVKLIVVNEEALEAGERYLDEDLNRAFPGDPDADTHEGRLAAKLTDALEGTVALSLHSTQSYPKPFAITREVDDLAREFVPALPVDSLVTAGTFTDGRLLDVADVIEVEAGHQGSERAAENAALIVDAFLKAAGVLPGEVERREHLPVYRLSRSVPKAAATDYDLLAANFERVSPGEPFAAAGGEEVVADEPFYPVLMSAEGYESIFGYAAEHVGSIEG
ncbi:succinylglutamate desuccinylase [Salinarchaeum sp. Harcht-Bsk1]|uniref:succinylglutamate desuccinylase/aspartoacylase domain-containing protein n=1 Tax=Salinarchaeum sp. Harcht-Bsk1 TaxID=1333523 RepID=UPI0003423F35|nr:succinylglutamate desuccinylase/aspartoacylase family protein [Salinarchaeum sp. Harcht-Bsk1]AGN01512.1 succinylglutamate desuccinylase [Salinarchaeum sp. Harcht-Bsk1]